jgi:hypothetical protein
MKRTDYWKSYQELTDKCLNDIEQIFKENKTDRVELYHDSDEENIDNPLILPFYMKNGDISNEEVQSIYIDHNTIKIKTEFGDYDLINDCSRENYIFVYETLCKIFNID